MLQGFIAPSSQASTSTSAGLHQGPAMTFPAMAPAALPYGYSPMMLPPGMMAPPLPPAALTAHMERLAGLQASLQELRGGGCRHLGREEGCLVVPWGRAGSCVGWLFTSRPHVILGFYNKPC